MKHFSLKIRSRIHSAPDLFPDLAPLDARCMKEMDRRIEQWVREQRYLDDIRNNDDFARSLGVDRVTVSRYFLLVRKEDPRTWRTGIRIQKARELMEDHPDLPVAMISEAVGFSDRSNFSRQFRKFYGVTPQTWKNRYLETRHKDINPVEVKGL